MNNKLPKDVARQRTSDLIVGLASKISASVLTAADVNTECDTALADYDPPTKTEMDSGHALLATPAQVTSSCTSSLNTYDPPTKTEMDSGLAALNDVSTAEVNTEVDTALNTALPTPPVANSVADILHKDGNYSYDNTTDSLQAIADSLIGGAGCSINTAVPTPPTANSLADILHKNASYTFDNTTDSLEAIADAVAGGGAPIISIPGTCDGDMGASTTVIDCVELAGYGNDYFNNKYWIQVVLNANSVGNAPEREYRKVTDYVSTTGVFTVNVFSANVEANDEIIVIHESILGFQSKEYTAAGNYTFTVPTNVYLLDEVMIVGGGGGGAGGGSGAATGPLDGTDGAVGTNGGSTSFVGFTVTGGLKGLKGNKATSTADGAASSGPITGGTYSTPLTVAPSTTVPYSSVLALNGGNSGLGAAGGGDSSPTAGTQSFAPASIAGTDTNYGGGGGGGGSSIGKGGTGGNGGAIGGAGGDGTTGVGYGTGGGGGGGGGGATYYGGGGGGGAGGASMRIINYPIYPTTALSLTVGAAGEAGAGGASSGAGSYAGGNALYGVQGYIRISWRERSVVV